MTDLWMLKGQESQYDMLKWETAFAFFAWTLEVLVGMGEGSGIPSNEATLWYPLLDFPVSGSYCSCKAEAGSHTNFLHEMKNG